MARKLRLVHYVNQFFGGFGGEEEADLPPRLEEGARGPGRLLETLAPDVEVWVTVVCGDNYAAQQPERAAEEICAALAAREKSRGERPDLLLAGPAFGAGRYGLACGAVCRGVRERLGIPALAGMHPDNPGADAHRREVVVVGTAADVMGMRDALEAMLRAGRKLLQGEALDPQRDGTLPQGRRRNVEAEKTGAERAVAMLLAKLRGEPFVTEYRLPVFDRVAPAPPLDDPASATIALVTSGGIVPRGNPDRIEAASASKFAAYSLQGLDGLTAETHQTAHGGYDPTFANADPNRVLPVDEMRALERAGRIGRLHERYYVTVGNGTSVEQARRFGREIAARLVADGVQAVILTST